MKVYSFSVPKSSRDHLLVQVDKAQVFYDRFHEHEEIQISYIVEGSGKLIVADSVYYYDRGDLFVIGKNCPHVFQSAPSDHHSHMISIFFSPDSFGADFFSTSEMEALAPFFENSRTGFKVSSQSESLCNSFLRLPELDGFSRFLTFLTLLKKLASSEVSLLSAFSEPKKLPGKYGKRLGVVFEYVMSNFQNDIDLNSIAALVYMTPPAFCRFFRRHTNKTFFQFLIELRIEHACQLLRTQRDLTIAEVSELSGFRSISNFNRMFKKLKACTPRSYYRQRIA